MSPNWPNTRDGDFSLHTMYVVSLHLRLSHVLKMWIDLLRSHQTLLRNWVVIKVVFGFVKKHAVRRGQLRRDLPLSTWERYIWAPRVIQIKKCMAMRRLRVNQESESRHREREVSLEQDQISWGKRNNMYTTLWRLVWYDLCVRIEVDMSCLRPLSTIGPCKSTRAMSIRMWAHMITHLREKPDKDEIQVRLDFGALMGLVRPKRGT